jgi:hypothetical protein
MKSLTRVILIWLILELRFRSIAFMQEEVDVKEIRDLINEDDEVVR